ncbi:MAG: HAMP domain-containing histidine kinase [Hormoscilla sp. GM102CHS1]|nr:HAMP domain-containing histidine kinase [Hormoscilla sp. GM102CHS1]
MVAATDAKSKPTITIRTEMTDSEAIVRIAENGPGMSADVVDRISFSCVFLYICGRYQAEPGNEGWGCSLPGIIEAKHGGKLSCTSTPGEGTEFVIYLPLGNS